MKFGQLIELTQKNIFLCVSNCCGETIPRPYSKKIKLLNIYLDQYSLVLDGKSSHEYPVNAGVPQGSIRGPTLFLL